MRLRIISVAQRSPAWVTEGYQAFARRMPRECSLELIEVRAEPRSGGKPVEALLAAEAARIRSAIGTRARIVVLDERGEDLSTVALAARLERWQGEAGEIALVIGGPDGIAAELKREAAERIRLSSLTLPHAMVRVLLAEALYRAWSLLQGHPYHRE